MSLTMALGAVAPQGPLAGAVPTGAVSKGEGGPKSGDRVSEAARNFEGILIRQMLAPLEASLTAGTSTGGNVPMVGAMVLESLSQSMVAGGGLGLADVIEQALRGGEPSVQATKSTEESKK